MSNSETNNREWQLLEKLVQGATVEQRRARRWGVFFKLLTFTYLFGLGYMLFNSDKNLPSSPDSEHTAVIDVMGVIADGAEASSDNIVAALREAFESDNAKAVVLRINSPGGSAVHADYVFSEIDRLKAIYPKKVYAVITDIGASGAYYIAAAADEIYANPGSIVGSIGVRLGFGFGFEELMKKVGVERRVVIAGEHKAILDPFLPMREDERIHMSNMLAGVHQQFIDRVKQGRGTRLAENEKIFSGLIWNGGDARRLGLIDSFGSAGYVAREIVGYEEMVDYTVRPNPVKKLFESMGASMAKTLAVSAGLDGSAAFR